MGYIRVFIVSQMMLLGSLTLHRLEIRAHKLVMSPKGKQLLYHLSIADSRL